MLIQANIPDTNSIGRIFFVSLLRFNALIMIYLSNEETYNNDHFISSFSRHRV